MSKKGGVGKFLAFATVAGAVAAGISYFVKYKTFNKELDEDFHDFEDEDDTVLPNSTMNRNYVSLNADKDELIVAAGDMLNAAKDVAGAAKNVVKDAVAFAADTTRDAVSAATDAASTVKADFEKEDEVKEEDVKPETETKAETDEGAKKEEVADTGTTTVSEDTEAPEASDL